MSNSNQGVGRSRLVRSGAILFAVMGLVVISLTRLPIGAAAESTGPGEAIATSAFLGIAPTISGVSLTVTTGASQAQYQAGDATASAQTLNLGGLGVLLSEDEICGSTLLKSSELPTALTADSGNGPSNQTNGSSTVGSEKVAVNPSPESASATTAPASLSIPGILTIEGASSSSVGYDESSNAGTATSTVTEDVSLLGGLVELKGMTWTVTQTLSASTTSSSSFSLGTVTLNPGLGTPLSLPVTLSSSDSTSELLAAINKVLAVVGIALTPPSSSTNPGSGALSLSPLVLSFSGSALTKTLLSPALNEYPAISSVLFGKLPSGSSCADLGTLVQDFLGPIDSVETVVAGIAEGSGALDVDLGGAAVDVQAAPDYTNPFGSGTESGNTVPVAPGTSSSSLGIVGTSVLPGSGGEGSLAPSTSPPPATSPGQGGAQSLRSQLVHCVTTSPAGHQGCSNGFAEAAGISAVVIGIALFAADLVYDRNSRRKTRKRVPA